MNLELVDTGGVWNVLEPGIHDATLDDVERCFAINGKRKVLFSGLKMGCQALKYAGCSVVYIDGSFVTSKPAPGDFDVCWDPQGVDASKLDSVLLDFDNGRINQKKKYLGEFFPSSATADGHQTFVEFFQTDKDTGNRKGIVCVRL